MWAELVCGLLLYRFVKRFFYEDDALLDLHSNYLFAIAERLERLYNGSKAYVGLQIPDQDSASRKNIDIVLVTHQEAFVISVKNVSGFVSTDKDGNWVCTDVKHHKSSEIFLNPVAETKQLVTVLKEYLEQRGVALPEEYLSFKVICPNPDFRSIPNSFPPEVVAYNQWSQLKPEIRNLYSGWIKGLFRSGKKKMQETFSEKLNSVLRSAPIWDRLELKGGKFVLGEFLEFKGKQDDLHVLRKIKRSKVSHLTTVQKLSIFGFVHSTVQLVCAPRDYRGEGTSWSSKWEELTVRSCTEVVFRPKDSAKTCWYKLSSTISISLSA